MVDEWWYTLGYLFNKVSFQSSAIKIISVDTSVEKASEKLKMIFSTLKAFKI